jgi:hypothetical protein
MGDPFTKPYGGDMFDDDPYFASIFFENGDDFGDEELSFEDYEILRDMLGPSSTVWVTKEGKRIPIVEMEDAHVINTILMLERNGKTVSRSYPSLLVEARKRNLPLDKVIERGIVDTCETLQDQ